MERKYEKVTPKLDFYLQTYGSDTFFIALARALEDVPHSKRGLVYAEVKRTAVNLQNSLREVVDDKSVQTH